MSREKEKRESKKYKSTGVASVLNIESGTEVLLAHLADPSWVRGCWSGHAHLSLSSG